MNVWGIRYSADRRSERMKGIAKFLRESDYDLVFIQELWSFYDYKLLMSSYRYDYGTRHGKKNTPSVTRLRIISK